MRWHVAELLRVGWSPQELLSSIDAPERNRNELPRVWAARHDAQALEKGQKDSRAFQTRLRAAQTATFNRKEQARRLAVKLRFQELSAERVAELEALAVQANPQLADRPGFMRYAAIDLFDKELSENGVDVGQVDALEVDRTGPPVELE